MLNDEVEPDRLLGAAKRSEENVELAVLFAGEVPCSTKARRAILSVIPTFAPEADMAAFFIPIIFFARGAADKRRAFAGREIPSLA